MGKISHLSDLVSATFSAASLVVAVGTVSVAFFFFLGSELLSLERFDGRCFSCCSLASMSCCTSAVVTGDEDGDDGEEIVAELGVGVVNLVCLIANHDFAATALEDVLDEFEGDTTEPVTMGDHNLADISFERSVQNSEKTGALPVDATRDVRDDFVLRVRFLEQLDLAPEVVPLRGTRDPRVDDAGASTGGGCDGFAVRVVGAVSVEHREDVTVPVQSLLLDPEAHDVDLPAVCPPAQGGGAYTEAGLDL